MVLRHVSEYQIFRYYLGVDFKIGVAFRSPFRKERNPSFNIYKNESGKLYFKDFGNSTWGDCFDFIMQKYNIDLPSAIMMVGVDFDISSFEGHSDKFRNRRNMIRTYANKINLNLNVHEYPKEEPAEKEIKNYDIEFCSLDKRANELDKYFYDKYGIRFSMMSSNVYNLQVASKVNFVSNSGKNIEIVSEKDNPIFVYKGYEDEKSVRFYRPYAKEYQLKHFGSIVKGDYFGKKLVRSISNSGTAEMYNLIFCAGQKDALCVSSSFHKSIGIAMGSEGNSIRPEILTELYMMGFRDENMYVLYDNDKTGIERSIRISKETGLKYVATSSFFSTIFGFYGFEEINECKDVADLCEVLKKNLESGIGITEEKILEQEMINSSKKEILII